MNVLHGRPHYSKVARNPFEWLYKSQWAYGIEVKAYLEKARIMFNDRDFQWDLEQFERGGFQ